MNNAQRLWWEQACSDQRVFELLRREGLGQCHTLHYLQMVTEKLSKAYLWRAGHPPPRTHAAFVQFLRLLGQIKANHREQVARLFSFKRYDDFQQWIRAVMPIAYELEHLTPALANEGPNSEYPWPHAAPITAPASYQFRIWSDLEARAGRELMRVIKIAVLHFEEYVDL